MPLARACHRCAHRPCSTENDRPLPCLTHVAHQCCPSRPPDPGSPRCRQRVGHRRKSLRPKRQCHSCQDSFRESRSRPGCRHGQTTTCGRSGRAWFSEPGTGAGVRATAGWASPNAIRVAPPRGQWPAHPAGPSGSTSRWPSPNCVQCVPGSPETHRWATRPGLSASCCNSTSSQPCDHGEDRKTSPDTFPVPAQAPAVLTL